MASFFTTMGRLTGHALRSQAVDRAITKSVNYVLSEMKLADIRLKKSLLKKKRTRHLYLLGKTVYRLSLNDIDPVQDNHTHTITRVLREIDMEIKEVNNELQQRKQSQQKEKK